MAWIELHDNIWEHHKTVKLCDELAINEVQAVGHLVSLWQFAMRNAPDTGDLAAWDDCGIAKAARWPGVGNSETFCNALRNAKLLDGHKIHDWDEFTLHFKASLERRERKREQVRERVRNYRQKKSNAVGNAPVTLSNAATLPNLTLPNRTKPTTPKPPKGDWPGFEIFWKAYPRRIAKANALKAWNKLKPDESLVGDILAAIGKQSRQESWTKEGGAFIPHPATWLNAKRWTDEIKFSGTSSDFVPTKVDPSKLNEFQERWGE